MHRPLPVVDVFAGPGGLGEGFSRLTDRHGRRVFDVVLSVEADHWAHRTLRLRKFTRAFPEGDLPEAYYAFLEGRINEEQLFEKYPAEAAEAEKGAWHFKLGNGQGTRREASERISDTLQGHEDWVLVGGPPCQAYSVIGRVRNRAVSKYVAHEDERHFLYQEYLRIIARHRPTAFVFENVKGLLTADVSGQHIFSQLLRDLGDPWRATKGRKGGSRYRIVPLVENEQLNYEWYDPHDFVVRAEDFGVGQNRHRVILVGILDEAASEDARLGGRTKPPTVNQLVGGLPRIRSRISRGRDSDERWLTAVTEWLSLKKHSDIRRDRDLYRELRNLRDRVTAPRAGWGGRAVPLAGAAMTGNLDLAEWISDARLLVAVNHESKSHMPMDLRRYFYCAAWAKRYRSSPRLRDFPKSLLPNHRSANGGSPKGFADRFRVQCAGRPSTTIMSHIHKDGHYYIHPDPTQCRSLTVREAARLQSFPDNYFFHGAKTSQFVQVGNAVPPYLAKQIAEAVARAIGL